MDVNLIGNVIAAVTVRPERVSGGIPVFHARDEKEMERLSVHIAKITLGMVHDLENGTYIIVRH